MTVIRNGEDAPGVCKARQRSCWTLLAPDPQEVRALNDLDRTRLLQASALMARDALRVLALAERPLDALADPEVIEQDLTFLGLVGLQDPPRAEAFDAVQQCKRAGIRTVMITGDHPDTAGAIARELGLLEPGDAVIVGRDLDRMDDQELAQRVPVLPSMPVSPPAQAAHCAAWKARGAVVAMTGDGVTDAPAPGKRPLVWPWV
jgi:Ca2+-transporting ATPase